MRGAEKKKRSHLQVMLQLVGLVKPLTGYMLAAVFMGLLGHPAVCGAVLQPFYCI